MKKISLSLRRLLSEAPEIPEPEATKTAATVRVSTSLSGHMSCDSSRIQDNNAHNPAILGSAPNTTRLFDLQFSRSKEVGVRVWEYRWGDVCEGDSEGVAETSLTAHPPTQTHMHTQTHH